MAKKKAIAKKTTKKTSKPAKAGHGNFIQLDGEIWPMERDVLFRPDRLKYVRKLIKPEGCVFCTAAAEPMSFESLCVYRTEHSMVVLNKYPYNSGHVLVIPKKHVGELTDLSDAAYQDLMEVLRLTTKGIKESYQPSGLNVGLNEGAASGAGIPSHLHFHVIPRWPGDLNFFSLIAETKTVIESLEVTFERLITYFKGHPSA